MRTIRTYLLLLTVVAAAPPILFGAFVLERQTRGQSASVGRDVVKVARAINLTVDGRVGERLTALQALAVSPSLQSGDLEAFRVEMAAAARLLQAPSLLLCDLQGRELLDTRLKSGEPPVMRNGARFAAEAAATGRPVVSDLYKGAISGRWVASVEAPVVVSGQVRYVLAATVDMAVFTALIGKQRLPEEWITSIIDRRGLFIARSRDGETRTGTPASPAFAAAAASEPSEGWLRTRSVDGQENYLGFSRSELTGWSVGIGVPVGLVRGPIWQEMLPLAVAGLGLASLSLLVSTRIARRIQMPIMALTRLASDPGAPAPAGLGLAEAEAVAQALRATRAHERQAAESLLASEARYRALAEAQPSLTFVTDAQGRNTYTNRAFQDFTGLQADALLGDGWLAVIHPDDRDRTAAAWAESVRTSAPYEIEHRFRRADGVYRWFLGRGVPALDAHGAVTAWFGTATDITDLVAGRETLARQGDALEAQVAARTAERDRTWLLSRDLLSVIDAKGRFVSVNPAFTATLGHSEETFLATSFIDFVHPDDREATIGQQVRARDGESIDRGENRLRCADGGYRTLSWTTRTQDGMTYCVARDVTAERATEAALRQAEGQARQAQKLEAVGQLTGGVAHDFNNLLQVVSANLELLAPAVAAAGEPFSRRFTAATEAVRRGAALTRQLLAFARKQPLEPRVLDPGRLLRAQGELLRRTLGETIEVEVIVRDDVWNVFADLNQLENAILNLAVNARDAIASRGPGSVGRLTLEACNARVGQGAADQAELEAGDYVCIAVSDTGPGMPPEVVARAFEPFFTTKPDGQGTGLGLAQVYGFTRQSGGHVLLSTKLGEGTTLRVYLPRALGGADRPDDAAPAAPEAAGGTESVLVVEDDAEVRSAAVEMLDSLGYRTLTACDGASALAILQSDAAIDLVFTDVVMPGPVGSVEMARRAREMRPGIAVLFTSGYTERGVVNHGRLDPGAALLPKPYGRDELARKLRSTLGAPREGSAAPASAVRGSQPPRQDPACTPRTILLVEDDELIRLSAAMLLEGMGHTVVEAGSGAQALAMLASEPAIDVLMTDLGLPDISGADVIARARIDRPELMVIVATGSEAHGAVPGAAPLQKPYDLRQMRAALAQAEAFGVRRAPADGQR